MADKKLLITKLVSTGERADLYAQGHRYRDTILWDLSDLALVGIDYTQLQPGKETPCRFWAHVETSQKLNKEGNPYLDITGLEPFTPPNLHDNLLTELTGITQMLQDLSLTVAELANVILAPDPDAPATNNAPATGAPAEPSPTTDPDRPDLRYSNTMRVNQNPAEIKAYKDFLAAEGQAPSSLPALRQWVLDRQIDETATRMSALAQRQD